MLHGVPSLARAGTTMTEVRRRCGGPVRRKVEERDGRVPPRTGRDARRLLAGRLEVTAHCRGADLLAVLQALVHGVLEMKAIQDA